MTEDNEADQSTAVLDTVADYFTSLATFVEGANVTIDTAVSYDH